MMKLKRVYPYRNAAVYPADGARAGGEGTWQVALREFMGAIWDLIPERNRDNHIVAIVEHKAYQDDPYPQE